MTYSESELSALGAAVLRLDLMSFIHQCFRVLNPETTFSDAPHLQVIAAKMSDCHLGKGPKRLIFCLPPRSLKSLSVSVASVAWILGRDPSKRIICASYGQDLAEKHARDTRTILTSPFYQQLFPNSRLTKNSVSDFQTTRHGYRMATSVGGVLTGREGDILILDDPQKPSEALSQTSRDAVNDWFDNTLLSRLDNKETGVIIIVMQRLHQDDLVGHLLGRGDDWTVLSFPAIAEKDEEYSIDTVCGPDRYVRRAGEVLDPQRESLYTLLDLKNQIGSYNFASQYQQDPTPGAGNMVLNEWIQYYDPASSLPPFSLTLHSWDTANKSGELNDYSVCTSWGVHNGRYFLLDVFRQKLDYPTLKRTVVDRFEKSRPNVVLIEDRASGTQLIQDLRPQLGYRLKPYAPLPQMDKTTRLHAQTALFEGGKVLLPRVAPWLTEYLRELTSFPGTKYDDQVDSTTQALDHMNSKKSRDVLGQTWSLSLSWDQAFL